MTRPLPYHTDVLDHLKEHFPAAWSHYASDPFQEAQDEAMRLHLLQSTVALTRESNAELYAMADEVAERLGVTAPVELFQGAEEGGLNAALLFSRITARVVLYGAIQDRLEPDELKSVLGHELTHHLLWTCDDGQYYVALRLLEGLAAHTASPTLAETFRLWTLNTEVAADRGGMQVTDANTATRTLIKVRTGLKRVSVDDYLAQSHELLKLQGTGSREWTHPEAHIRALALERYAREDEEPDEREQWIRRVVEGPIHLDALDLMRRHAVSALCRRVVAWLIQPPWFQTDAVLGHTRMLFDDDPLPEPTPLGPQDIADYGDTVRQALAAILTDYVAIDPSLDDLPLLRADQVAEHMGLQKELHTLVNRGLKRTKKSIAAALEERDETLDAALDEVNDGY